MFSHGMFLLLDLSDIFYFCRWIRFKYESLTDAASRVRAECGLQENEVGTLALNLVYLRLSQEQFQNRCCFLEEILQFVFQEIRQFLTSHSLDKNVTEIQTVRKQEGTHMSIYLCLVHVTMFRQVNRIGVTKSVGTIHVSSLHLVV